MVINSKMSNLCKLFIFHAASLLLKFFDLFFDVSIISLHVITEWRIKLLKYLSISQAHGLVFQI